MKYRALATDYDGTLARNGVVSSETIHALERFRGSGRKLIMVTGRELSDLKSVFPQLDLFDCIVAENGALVYHPLTGSKRLLGQRRPDSFIQRLRQLGVKEMNVGEVIVATWRLYEESVRAAIREWGDSMEIIFNKEFLMILPPNTNKMTGLAGALEDLKLLPQNVIGVGDAENDEAFLGYCGFVTAVSNAIPALKQAADFVTKADRGAGVTELIDRVIADDLASFNTD